MRWPLDNIKVIIKHGQKIWYGIHRGVDLRAPIGTPIYAPEDGIVVRQVWDKLGGWWLVYRGDSGIEYKFGHLYDFRSWPKTRHREDDILATTGNTGKPPPPVKVYEPHLHFETWRDGKAIDPETLLKKGNIMSKLQEAFRREMENPQKLIIYVVGVAAGGKKKNAHWLVTDKDEYEQITWYDDKGVEQKAKSEKRLKEAEVSAHHLKTWVAYDTVKGLRYKKMLK